MKAKKTQKRKLTMDRNRKNQRYNKANNSNDRKEVVAARRRQEKRINRELESEIEYV